MTALGQKRHSERASTSAYLRISDELLDSNELRIWGERRHTGETDSR